ncbi:MAG TPA: hypothetical protein DCG57_07260, partial [Candidatus Riflebacteria bacterium]|nr:hypothetical protein [Candidatus Riflebacteria bacterium]
MSEAQNKTLIKTRFAGYIGPVAGVAALLFLMMFQGGFFATGQILPGINLDKPAETGAAITVEETLQPDY